MNEMVDRVARAIGDALGDPSRHRNPDSYFSGKIGGLEGTQISCRELARAAIEAMRGPTTGMLKAGAAAYETAGQGFLIGAYNSMIDAAKEE